MNVTGDVSLMDANDAANYVQSLTGDMVNVVFGARIDEDMKDKIQITVIATGLDENATSRASEIPSMMRYSSTFTTPQPVRTVPVRETTQTPTPAVRQTFQSTVNPAAAPRPTATVQTPQPAAVPPQPKAPEPQETFTQSLNTPVKPVSNVAEKNIQIPDFLRNTRK